VNSCTLIEALAIVLFVSFVALGWRTGSLVALSVRWCWRSLHSS